MFFASASHSVSPTTSASHARIDLSSRRFTGRRSVLSSRRPFVGASDAHHHHRRVGSRRIDVSVVAAAAASNADDEIAMLTKMLQLAKERKEHEATAGDEQKTASKGGYDGTRFDFWDFYRALFDSSKGEKEIFSTYRERRSRCGRTVRYSNVEAHVARVEEPLEPPTMGTDRRYVRTSSSSIEERESVRRLAATKY